MRIFVTGGAGYIGSHTLLQLLKAKHNVLVYDNYSNSSPETLLRIKQNRHSLFGICEGEIQDLEKLDAVFSEFKPEAVIHFAGLKAVGESTAHPLKYYAQNVSGSVHLLQAMQRHDCRKIVFSSSATVYGEAKYIPYDEEHPIHPTNPYGRTKYFIEEIIRDWVKAHPIASAVILRYFNPVGADPSGHIGEDPSGIVSNVMPLIAQVATGKLSHLSVFGDDYNTRDGTGERDYIHVEDLARAHLAALDLANRNKGCETLNVGTGSGTTVLELIREFEKVSERRIPYKMVSKRSGDVARSIAAVHKAERLLGWRTRRSVEEMCRSTWLWHVRNS